MRMSNRIKRLEQKQVSADRCPECPPMQWGEVDVDGRQLVPLIERCPRCGRPTFQIVVVRPGAKEPPGEEQWAMEGSRQ